MVTAQQALSSYAVDLRDVADGDYIEARVAYRLGLMEQFLWASLQACEKYLKAILLFEGQSVRNFSHVTVDMVNRIEHSTTIKFNFDADEVAFLQRLQDFGNDRYRQASKYTGSRDLIDLDRCVWKIRRFCQSLKFVVGGKHRDETATYNAYTLDDSHKIRIVGGHLEKVLGQKSKPKTVGVAMQHYEQRQALVRQNFYYSARKRRKMKVWFWSGFKNPATVYDASRKKILGKYVR